jgi:acetyl-CoA C-acetyltransferase
MSDSSIVILSAKRTPIGSFNGALAGLSAVALGAAAIRSALEASGLAPNEVSEVLMGCVLPAGLGQAPARQAAIAAGIPLAAGATTLNKVCGSGMKAIMLGHDLLRAGSAEYVVAGGMESMTNAPYLLQKARFGYRFGHSELLDHMALDGLQNAADRKAMGEFAELCASQYGFTREQQDAFAAESVRRALAAQADGAFADEIVPVVVPGRKGDVLVSADEEPPTCDIGKIPSLRPAFKKDGTVTAASSSKISDGAAALVLTRADCAASKGRQPIARIVAHATHSQEPEWFTTAPVGAIQKVLAKAGWRHDEVDLYEINEAFAVVAMAPIRELGLDPARVNVHGGACALGHPIGASGARLVVTLIHALRRRGGRRGVASLCIGGGEATALAVELL